MIFGKIEYLNLLPFHVFMKRFLRSSQAKMVMEYRKNVPSAINQAFLRKKVDAAFISSIKAKGQKHLSLGIVAKKSVKSVVVIPHAECRNDVESASSNALAKVLKIKGEVLIGDKALRYVLQSDNYIDLAEMWYKKYNLPFVFALLCYHKDKQRYKKIEKRFLSAKIKIPRYILDNSSKKTAIDKNDILEYLQLISYKVDNKARFALKRFYSLTA